MRQDNLATVTHLDDYKDEIRAERWWWTLPILVVLVTLAMFRLIMGV